MWESELEPSVLFLIHLFLGFEPQRVGRLPCTRPAQVQFVSTRPRKGWSNSTAGRAFALHAANPGSIPPSLSESPASYRASPASYMAEPGKIFDMPKTVTASLTMETLLVPARANQ